eukprot:scaffold53060_cov29-Tisochrysis_lutea.AAC.9
MGHASNTVGQHQHAFRIDDDTPYLDLGLVVALPVFRCSRGARIDGTLLHLTEQQDRGHVLGAKVKRRLDPLARKPPVSFDEGVDPLVEHLRELVVRPGCAVNV